MHSSPTASAAPAVKGPLALICLKCACQVLPMTRSTGNLNGRRSLSGRLITGTAARHDVAHSLASFNWKLQPHRQPQPLPPARGRIVTVRNLRRSEVALRVRFLAHLQLAPQRPLPFDRHGAYYRALPVAVARDLSCQTSDNRSRDW